jgi:DNA-binding transcriptional MerR regulator
MKDYYIWESSHDQNPYSEVEIDEIKQLQKLELSSDEIKQIMKDRRFSKNFSNHTMDQARRERIIVPASHIDEAIQLIQKARIKIDDYLFAGTLPVKTDTINYLDFVEWAISTCENINEGDPDYIPSHFQRYREIPPVGGILEYSVGTVLIQRI